MAKLTLKDLNDIQESWNDALTVLSFCGALLYPNKTINLTINAPAKPSRKKKLPPKNVLARMKNTRRRKIDEVSALMAKYKTSKGVRMYKVAPATYAYWQRHQGDWKKLFRTSRPMTW